MVSIVEEKYKVIFLKTASSYLKKLQQSVITLTKEPDNKSEIENAYLAAHSLKSETLMMRYKEMANYFLLLENIFKGKRAGTFSYNAELLIVVSDELEKIIQAIPHMVNEDKHYDILPAYQNLKTMTGMTIEEL